MEDSGAFQGKKAYRLKEEGPEKTIFDTYKHWKQAWTRKVRNRYADRRKRSKQSNHRSFDHAEYNSTPGNRDGEEGGIVFWRGRGPANKEYHQTEKRI